MAEICERCYRPKATDVEWDVDHGDCNGCTWCDARCWQSHDCAVRARDREELEARVGRAVLALVDQIHRHRRNQCPTMGFGLEPQDIAAAVESEVAEVRAEEIGSPAAKIETAGVVATALHLMLVHGGDIVGLIECEAVKLRRRLDVVEAGGTWADAKRMEREHG